MNTDKSNTGSISDCGNENDRKEQHRARDTALQSRQKNKRVFWALVAVIATLVAVYFQFKPVQVPKTFDRARVAALINQASSDTQKAWQKFEGQLTGICAESEAEMAPAIRRAARKASKYGSCVDVVYNIAVDKVWGGNRTEEHLKSQIMPEISGPNARTAEKLNAAILEYEHALRAIASGLANDLSRIPYFSPTDLATVKLDGSAEPELNIALDNLAIDMTTAVISLGTEVVLLVNKELINSLLKRAADIAARIFARQVGRVAGSVACAAADGPLPVGDLVAGIGFIWVAWDISSSRAEFEQNLVDSLTEMHNRQLESAVEQCASSAKRLNDGFDKYYRSLFASLKGA